MGTTTDTIHLIGAGDFALEVLEYALAAGLRVAALIEPVDQARVGMVVHDRPVIATADCPPDGRAVVAISGDRLAWWAGLEAAGWRPATVIHPRAVVSPSARIGPGTVIGPLAVVGAATEIGAHCLVSRGASVGHHSRLGDGVSVYPSAAVAGGTTLGTGVRVGMGAAVVDNLTVGGGVQIGAGAVVVRDVPAGVRVQGTPARRYEGPA